MAHKRLSISSECSPSVPWTPTDKQREAAEFLALGYSQKRTAALVGISQPAISKWWNTQPEFQQYVMDMTAQFMASRENILAQSVALATLIYHRALTGDVDADDEPTVELATRLLERTIWPLVARQQAQLPAGGDAA